jgi:hypothetical protein
VTAHKLIDWTAITEDGRVLQYACDHCGVRIPAAVIMCDPADEAGLRALRAQLPDRLIFAVPGARRELADARIFASLTGQPPCSPREIES